jgi:CheY-like chemotaxis protein
VKEGIMIDLAPILLVDDNLRDVELTLEALAECNLANRVAVAEDGIEAMEYLRCEGKYAGRTGGDPAVVLLDIKMPRMDGLEVLQAIRGDERLKTVPVVMLTSSREGPDLEKSYALGANAFVVKPVSFGEFIDAVRQIGIFWAILNERPVRPGV